LTIPYADTNSDVVKKNDFAEMAVNKQKGLVKHVPRALEKTATAMEAACSIAMQCQFTTL